MNDIHFCKENLRGVMKGINKLDDGMNSTALLLQSTPAAHTVSERNRRESGATAALTQSGTSASRNHARAGKVALRRLACLSELIVLIMRRCM